MGRRGAGAPGCLGRGGAAVLEGARRRARGAACRRWSNRVGGRRPAARRGRGRDRRHRRATGPARGGRGRTRSLPGGAGGGRRRSVRGGRGHRPARRAACERGPDRHVRHPQDRPPRRPGCPGLRRGAPRRHRAGAAGGAGGGVAAGRRRCAAAGAVGVRAQVHPRSRRGPRRIGDLSGGCRAVHLGCGDRPRRDGPLHRLRRGRGACPAPRGRDSRGPGAGLGRRVGRRRGRARRR